MGQVQVDNIRVSEDDSSMSSSLVHLAQLWAKRYVDNLGTSDPSEDSSVSVVENTG